MEEKNWSRVPDGCPTIDRNTTLTFFMIGGSVLSIIRGNRHKQKCVNIKFQVAKRKLLNVQELDPINQLGNLLSHKTFPKSYQKRNYERFFSL
jgi:hypothetical protein